MAPLFDVFREIQEDKEEEARIAALRAEQDKQLEQHNAVVTALNGDIEVLRNDRSWFGLGGTKKSALAKIALKEQAMQQERKEIADLSEEIANTKFERDTQFAEFATEKAKLRELLDITSDEHKERQQALVDAANSFVDMAETRTSNVLIHLEGINDQVDRLGDSNGGMRNVYAVISEAVEDAEAENTKVRDALMVEPADESNIQKMNRENPEDGGRRSRHGADRREGRHARHL